MDAGRKIRAIRKSKNLNISDVELKAGISEGNLSRIETGKQWPKEETLRAIAEALECRVVDFFLDTSPDFPPSQQIPLISYSETAKLKNIKSTHFLYQELTQYASGDPSKWIPIGNTIPENAFALEIGDSSMFPEFQERDHVIIDPDLEPKPGDFILAKTNENETLFRKYRPRSTGSEGNIVFQLVPLNEDYPSLQSDISTVIIIGTMLEHRRYRK